MQLKLSSLDPAAPPRWEDLDPAARRAFIVVMARTLAKAVGRPLDPKKAEDTDDR